MFNPPTTPICIFANINIALNLGVLMDRNFYTENNLRSLTGAKTAKFSEKSDVCLRIWLLDHPGSRVLGDSPGHNLPLTQFRINWHLPESGLARLSISISFSVRRDGLDFDSVVGIFGKDWKYNPLNHPTPNRVYDVQTHPNGYARIRYDRFGDKTKSFVTFEFGHDGYLLSSLIVQETVP